MIEVNKNAVQICSAIVSKDAENQNVRCKNPVRYHGSFVCEQHVWDPQKYGFKKKLPLGEMQKRLVQMGREVREKNKTLGIFDIK